MPREDYVWRDEGRDGGGWGTADQYKGWGVCVCGGRGGGEVAGEDPASEDSCGEAWCEGGIARGGCRCCRKGVCEGGGAGQRRDRYGRDGRWGGGGVPVCGRKARRSEHSEGGEED